MTCLPSKSAADQPYATRTLTRVALLALVLSACGNDAASSDADSSVAGTGGGTGAGAANNIGGNLATAMNGAGGTANPGAGAATNTMSMGGTGNTSPMMPAEMNPGETNSGGMLTAGGGSAMGGSGMGSAGSPSDMSMDNTAGMGGMNAAGGGNGEPPDSTDAEPVAAGDQFSVDVQLASDVDPSAPGTIGIVTWSIEGVTPTRAVIDFGLDESYGMQAPVDLSEEGFRTLLLGMKPAQTYNFRIVVTDAAGSYASDNYTLETGPPTDVVSIASFDVVNEEAREPGFLVTSYWRGDGASVIFILDADGEIVWWYDTGTDGIARARMSADAKNMWMVVPTNATGGPLQRVSMDTLDGETYSASNNGSHDITPVGDGRMAYLDYSGDCDKVAEIEPSGITTLVWDTQEWWDQNGGNGMCHTNALRYSAAEDLYTVSDVSTDIFVVDRSGILQWSLAEIVDGGVQTWGGRQHGHHLLDNSMVVFANAGGDAQASAVIEYDLEGNEIFRYDSGEQSANLGDVQKLPGGNYFVTYSNSGIAHEVDPDGNLVLSIDSGGSSMGYSMWRASLYGRPPDLDL